LLRWRVPIRPRSQCHGKNLYNIGRPRKHNVDPGKARALLAEGLSLRAVARTLGTHHTVVARAVGTA